MPSVKALLLHLKAKKLKADIVLMRGNKEIYDGVPIVTSKYSNTRVTIKPIISEGSFRWSIVELIKGTWRVELCSIENSIIKSKEFVLDDKILAFKKAKRFAAFGV